MFKSARRARAIETPLIVALCAWLTTVASASSPGESDAVLQSQPVMLDLQTALESTLQRNPDLVSQRQNLNVSAEALAVARHFPTSLNPTVSLDVRPWVFERIPGDGVNELQMLVNVTLSQPIELGHRTALRTSIAQASYCQTRFTVLQAEMSALVQTYRLHQAALYRREKLEVARRLVEFNQQLLQTLERQVQATRATPADLVLARVESQTATQQLETAEQEYVASLAELRSQLGIPDFAGSAEPSGTLAIPEPTDHQNDEALVRMAVTGRPEILAAQAAVSGSRAAVSLACADRIPTFSVGPAYEKDESGVTFYGLTASSPVPVLNGGGPLVRQREAEYRRDCVALDQLRQRTAAQVRAALAQWHHAQQYVRRTQATIEPMRAEMEHMQRLYAAGETDVLKLLQVRQRVLESENGRLDSVSAAIQSYANLLVALGELPLIGSAAEQASSATSGGAR